MFDPWANKYEVLRDYNINLLEKLDLKKYEAIVLAVAHNQFKKLDLNDNQAVIFDIKGVLGKADERL